MYPKVLSEHFLELQFLSPRFLSPSPRIDLPADLYEVSYLSLTAFQECLLMEPSKIYPSFIEKGSK